LGGTLSIQAVADEETLGLLGTGHILESEKTSAEFGICGEPSQLHPMLAARGLQWWRIRVKGRSAHASTPEAGINAIEKLADVIRHLRSVAMGEPHPLVGKPSINVALIEGGTKINMVPDWAEIAIDRRLVPGESRERSAQAIMDVLAEARALDPELDVEAELVHEADASEISADEEIVHVAKRTAEAVLGAPVEIRGMQASTDARLLINGAKIPTVIWGPGDLRQAHVVDEFIEVDQLVRCTEMYARAFAELLGNGRA
jgi:acetylornithine deacetylase/succinyl-diaminopimelate desuccinylase-like protein